MTEEIKEILDYLKDKDDYIEKFGYQFKRIGIDHCFQLSDCITNLQQENKAKTHQIAVLEEIVNYERNIRNDKLQQENEKLKEQNNDLRKIYKNTYKRLFKNGNDELARYFQAQIDDCPIFYVEPIIDYAKEYKIYKSRCEKANDFIDNYDVFKEFSFPLMKRDIENQIKSSIDYEFNSTFRKKFKNILNGSDNNE